MNVTWRLVSHCMLGRRPCSGWRSHTLALECTFPLQLVSGTSPRGQSLVIVVVSCYLHISADEGVVRSWNPMMNPLDANRLKACASLPING